MLLSGGGRKLTQQNTHPTLGGGYYQSIDVSSNQIARSVAGTKHLSKKSTKQKGVDV